MALVDLALSLAGAGLPAFPCGRNKKPAIAKANGGHGFLDAVTEPDAVRALFSKAPRAVLVGVPTGERSGFDVLDFDYRHGAGEWEAQYGDKLPRSREHRTQHGGKHLVLKHAPGVRNLASKFAPGMDVRGDGGYVIYPPSAGYFLVQDIELAEWPDWLLAIVLKAKPAELARTDPAARPKIDSKRLDGLVTNILGRVRAAPDGAKHFTLRNAALSFGGIQEAAGLSQSEAARMLHDALPSSVKDWKGADATIAWGLEHGRERPLVLEDRPQYQRNGYAGNSQESAAQTDRRKFDGLDHPDPLAQTAPQTQITVYAGLRHVAANAGLKAMVRAGVQFYQRDRTMVRASLSKAKAADGRIIEVPGIVQVTNPMLARALGSAAEWQKSNKDGELIRIDPPKEIVEQIAAMSGEWPFPPLAGVIGTPTLRPDGTVLAVPGYDAATGLVLMSPPVMPPIPEQPTWQDAERSLCLLNDLLSEFPFADDASRSVALSMILTAVLRGGLVPAVPMHVVTAPQPGTGKSYLLDTAAAIATGERCPVIAVAPNADETEKRLVGAALSGFPIIALDNVSDVLTGDFLAQATERPILQVRPLGSSIIIRIANTFTMFANGNNIVATADLVRRTLRCNLDADLENPEEREFTADPVATVFADRGKYIAACLTIARAYLAAGSPNRCHRLPSFSAWSDVVRSSLVWLKAPDPVESMDLARAEDPIRQHRAAIFSAWQSELGLQADGLLARDLINAINETDFAGGFRHRSLREALLAVAKDRNSSVVSPDRLGRWLRSAKNTRVGKLKLTVGGADAARPRWCLQEC